MIPGIVVGVILLVLILTNIRVVSQSDIYIIERERFKEIYQQVE